MFEFAKKGFYIGLGLASFTKERAESFAREFADQAKLSEDEGRKFAEYLRKESNKAREDLSDTVEEMVERTMKRMPFRSRLCKLEDRVARLEQVALSCCPEKAEELGIAPTTAEETADAKSEDAAAAEDDDSPQKAEDSDTSKDQSKGTSKKNS